MPPNMDSLKLFALDEKDLEIISACVQDSVLKTGEISYDAKPRAKGQPAERRRAVLHFDRVLSVKSSGLDRSKPDTVLSLLALRFLPDDAPSGNIELLFAEGKSMLLDVECLEVQLADIGGRWAAQAKPKHGV
jgi:hypothetical protein